MCIRDRAIKNVILTVPGEKPFNPTVGCRVREMLFEPLDAFTADTLQDEIINTINQYERRVKLMDVAVQPLWEQNQLNLSNLYCL